MRTVTFNTENAIFEFDLMDVQDHLYHYTSKHKVGEATKLLEFLSTQPSKSIDIPKDSQYFEYITLDLINAGKGSVTCIQCDTTYKLSQLKPITVGHGRSPFDLKPELRGCVIKKLFGKKQNPPMFGGKGYECPVGHELISIITWRT